MRHFTRLLLALLLFTSLSCGLPAHAGTGGSSDSSQPQSAEPVDSDRSSRALHSAAEYASLAADLRIKYAKPRVEWPKAVLIDHPDQKFAELGPLPEIAHPSNNPFTPAKAELGKQLFFDPRLSGSKQIACASCHDPDLNWADGRAVAFGHDRQAGSRNTPSIMNVAFGTSFFWDGRAASLETQAQQPVTSEIEMHSSPEEIAQRVNAIAGYKLAFAEVFGPGEITLVEIGKAIACFERTVVGGRSEFDQFLNGKNNALSDSAIRGLHLFRTSAGCINCHNGPNFTDEQYHNLGLTYYGRKYEDLGRYNVTKQPRDVGRFKTPSLRNVTKTAPYMHNGLFELPGVLNMYNAGMPAVRPTTQQMDDPLFPTTSPLLHKLNLSKQDLEDLTAFLESLEEPKKRIRPPELPAE